MFVFANDDNPLAVRPAFLVIGARVLRSLFAL